MSESKIRRKNKTYTATISTATASMTTIALGDMAGGLLQFGTVHSATTALITYVSAASSGPWTPLKNGSGTVDTITLSDHATAYAYPVPDGAYAAGFIKLGASHTTGEGVTCTVMVKG